MSISARWPGYIIGGSLGYLIAAFLFWEFPLDLGNWFDGSVDGGFVGRVFVGFLIAVAATVGGDMWADRK